MTETDRAFRNHLRRFDDLRAFLLPELSVSLPPGLDPQDWLASPALVEAAIQFKVASLRVKAAKLARPSILKSVTHWIVARLFHQARSGV